MHLFSSFLSIIQEGQQKGSSVFLPLDAAGAKGQDGDSIRHWKEIEERKGITHGYWKQSLQPLLIKLLEPRDDNSR